MAAWPSLNPWARKHSACIRSSAHAWLGLGLGLRLRLELGLGLGLELGLGLVRVRVGVRVSNPNPNLLEEDEVHARVGLVVPG